MFTVVGLATFLVMMAIWRIPIVAFTAEAQVLHSRRVADGNADELPDSIAQITSEQNLQRAGAAAQARTSGDKTGSSSADTSLSVAHLRKWVSVQTAPGPERGQTLVTVRYMGDHEETVVWFVDRLTAQFAADAAGAADKANERFHAERTMAIQREADAQRKMDQAKRMLDQFVQQQLVELESTQKSTLRDGRLGRDEGRSQQRQAATRADAGSDGQPANTPGIQPVWVRPGSTEMERNPDWTVLRQQLIAMEAHRKRLLISRTPEHPLVVDADASIRRLKNLMEKVPEFLPQEAPARALPQPTAEQVAENQNPLRKKSREELLAEIHSSKEYQDKHRQYLAAQQTYEAAADRVKYASARPPAGQSERVEILEPSRVIERHGGRPTGGRLLTLSLMSTSVGLAFALLKGLLYVFPVMTSKADVEGALDLRVFGEITTADGPEIPKTLKAIPSVIRLATTAGETTLFAVCVLLISLAIMDQVFAVQIRQDPFSAYSYAIDRVTSWSA